MQKNDVIKSLYQIAQWMRDNAKHDESLNIPTSYAYPMQLEFMAYHIHDYVEIDVTERTAQ
jgi:hypothetical protein